MTWTYSHTATFQDVRKEDIWHLWSDVNNWSQWNPGIERCMLEGPFEVGAFFTLKPKHGAAVRIQLVEVEKGIKFTDCTKFPGAKMYGIHEIVEEEGGLILTTKVVIRGPLEFIWRRLVGQKIAAKIPAQMEALVRLAQQKK